MAKLPKTFKISKDGKVAKTPRRKSVSQRIAEKKNPKRKYAKASP